MPDSASLSILQGQRLPKRPDMPASLLDAIQRRLEAQPDARLWTVDEAGRAIGVPYRELWPRAGEIAGGLAAAGVEPGSVVAVLAGSVKDFVMAFWACLMGGYTILPLSGRARRARGMADPDSLREIAAQVPGAWMLADAETLELAQALAGERAVLLAEAAVIGAGSMPVAWPAADPVCWLPTSGATGRDKLAGLGESALLARRFLRSDSGTEPADARMWVYDADSVTGLNAAFIHAMVWVQVPPAQVLARPALVLELTEMLKVRRLALTSSLARLVADVAESSGTTWDLSALRTVAMGAETVEPAVARRLAASLARHGAGGVRMSAGYGTTETGSLVTGHVVATDTQASQTPVILGGAAAGVELRIVANDGAVLPEGEIGMVEARCPDLIFSGYAGTNGDTARVDREGWWRTGDLGRIFEGALSLHGRVRQVIAVRGRKLALEDIENALAGLLGRTRRAVACRLDIDGSEQLGLMIFGPSLEGLRQAIQRVIGERFGIQPARVGLAPMNTMPLASSGKLLRSRVAAMLASSVVSAASRSARQPEDRLHSLWRECLPGAEHVSPDSHFFADGGDSLAAQRLFASVEAEFGVALRTQDFFADPTLRHLRHLVGGEMVTASPQPVLNWALPPEIYRGLLRHLEAWTGQRPTQDRLMAGLNTGGQRPPLFWVFQAGHELASLAARLGPDQPVYGFRSGHGVFRYDENSLQLVALRYVEDVLEVSAGGPLFIGGNCQGGRIALAMAQHLLRRKVHLPLLILMEWGFELTAYPGDLLFLYGRDSLEGNPWLRHAEPERAWKRLLGRVGTEVIPGEHGKFFLSANVTGLAAALSRHMAASLLSPPSELPDSARRADIEVGMVPSHLNAGQGQRIRVKVRNVSGVIWPEGLSLGNHWTNMSGKTICWRDCRQGVPELKPGEAVDLIMEITAPPKPGAYRLSIDIVEEGGRWFGRGRRSAPEMSISVV